MNLLELGRGTGERLLLRDNGNCGMNEEALFFFYKDLAWGQLLLYLVVWSGMKKRFPILSLVNNQQNLCAFPKNSKQERKTFCGRGELCFRMLLQ